MVWAFTFILMEIFTRACGATIKQMGKVSTQMPMVRRMMVSGFAISKRDTVSKPGRTNHHTLDNTQAVGNMVKVPLYGKTAPHTRGNSKTMCYTVLVSISGQKANVL